MSDAAENSDFDLLRLKKTRVVQLQAMEEQSVAREKALLERNQREEEERKRRLEEEEENKLDFAFTALKNGKAKGKGLTKKKGDSDKLKVGGTRSTIGSSNLTVNEKAGLKRSKNGMSKR